MERPHGVWVVICLNPVGDSDFLFVPLAPDMLIISFSERRFMLRQRSLPKYFASKAKWILRRYYFFLAAGNKKFQRVNATRLYVYDANESTRRLVEDGMSTGFTNTRTARGFSVMYHVFARKQCIVCSALRHKSYLTLPTYRFILPWNFRARLY